MYNKRIFIFWKHDKYIWCCSLSDKWIFTLYFDGALISRLLTIVKVNTFRKGEGCSNYTLYKMYSPVCHIPKKSKFLFSIQDLSPVYFVMVGTRNIVWNQSGWIKKKFRVLNCILWESEIKLLSHESIKVKICSHTVQHKLYIKCFTPFEHLSLHILK